MALTPSQIRRRKLNMLMAMSYAAYASTKAQFTPAALFAAGEVGAWFDPSDFNTMFQDSAGTTPVTAVEQPVGLLLDKSKGLALGAELVTNGDFSSATGWTITGSGVSITGGALNASTASTANIYSTITPASTTRTFRVSWTISTATAGDVILRLYNNGANVTTAGFSYLGAAGTYTAYVQTNAVPNQAWITIGGAGFTGSIDNISVRELPGNHASQSTSASRPVLSARVNLLTYSEDFSNAAWQTAGSGTAAVGVKTNNYGTAPDGTQTAMRVQLDVSAGSVGNQSQVYQTATVVSGVTYKYSAWIKTNDGSTKTIMAFSGGATSPTSLTVTGTWTHYEATRVPGGTSDAFQFILIKGTTSDTADLLVWHPDVRAASESSSLPNYQRIAAATDYDTSFPLYLKSDGVDDRLIGPAISNVISASAYEACIGARVLAASTSSASPWVNQSLFADSSGYVGVGYVTTSNIIGGFNFDGSTDTVTQSMTPPSSFVLQQRHSAGNLVLSLNGGSEASAASGDTQVLTGDTRVFSSNGSVSVPAHLYGLIVRATAFTAAERTSVLAWMNSKTRAY